MYFKKSISPVVAMALLLVVAVVGTVGFQGWFNDFSSQLFTDTEQKSGNSVGRSGIDQVIGNTLYFSNSGSDVITITKVEVNGEDCYQRGSYSSGVSEIDLYDCMNNLSTTTPEVVVYTDDKIYSKKILVPSNFVASFSYPQGYFVSVWDTRLNTTGSTAQNQIGLPLESSGTYNFNINWGDGTNDLITTWNQSEINHTYIIPGEYIIKINGVISGWRFNNGRDKEKLLEIRQWGPLNLGNSHSYFFGCSNFRFTGTDSINLTGTTDLRNMFYGATSFTGDLSGWDTSEVTEMGYMFRSASSFNSDISSWNVTNVTNMYYMFSNAVSFNQNLNNWKINPSVGVAGMFQGASSFNSDLDSWDFNPGTTTSQMFQDATSFNGNISTWNMTGVLYVHYMFADASSFNQSIGSWDMSSIEWSHQMFSNAVSFNQDLSSWNVGKVTNIGSMFSGATSFNQDLSSWNVGNVTGCGGFNSSTPAWVLPQPVFSGC